jgi:hypothetical protein
MIVACCYKKRVGKDEFYKQTKALFPDKKVVRVAFADSLKDEVYDILLKPNNLPKEIMDDPEKKKILRPFLQWYGTEFKRNPDFNGNENYWIERAVEKILNIKQEDPDSIIVVTDARFVNEIRAIKNLGGYAINIIRDEVYDKNDQHPSETILDDHQYLFDFFIMNNSTLEDYKDMIEDVFQMIKEREFASKFETPSSLG